MSKTSKAQIRVTTLKAWMIENKIPKIKSQTSLTSKKEKYESAD